MENNELWFKRTVIYELNVRSFYDANGDGIGDLRGVTARLDYLKKLGVETIWLLPITDSPLRDGGYDVSDMFNIHPAYGTLDDFRELVGEAHKRDLKIMVEMIPNHTSDQHPWFQASRDPSHKDHVKYRDFYVWNDDDRKYRDVRIIFVDYEKSNWTFDPVRKQYYWHRFFHHQPDLNYDNPEVQRAMMKVVQFWIDQGADAIRVDAPPYLIEREGTNCENLPESHAYYKRLRAFVEAYAPDVMLLAEANQWPEDVREYFGDGDEFHMNFHFPLMPRIFMALARGVREPIEKIIARTPALPDSCAWGTFLRCHDELTLEMVTPEERSFMWDFYAPEPRMRLNLGIRRRLAPLLDNDMRKIRLAHALLLSFIGTPVLYYGDEIGMGDNILLEDRDGVRTPMQWDGSANGGFSNAPASILMIPIIDDGTYGYKMVNVASQEKDPDSFYSWLSSMLALRRNHPGFGEGQLKLLSPENPHILAYLHEGGETLLFVNNLSGEEQKFSLDAGAYHTAGLLDLTGGTSSQTFDIDFHLAPFGFRWYQLAKA
ncbi:MAG: maltose alpha-D-glucosyltransferase [Anaerolineaceae bacterium]